MVHKYTDTPHLFPPSPKRFYGYTHNSNLLSSFIYFHFGDVTFRGKTTYRIYEKYQYQLRLIISLFTK